MKAIDKALSELDELGEMAIRKRILGEGEEPVADGGEEMPSEDTESGEEEISPELLEKLRAALAAE